MAIVPRFLLLLLLAVPVAGSQLAGCTRPAATLAQRDEAELRDAWAIPSGATLVSITVNPPVGGTFGREGLRRVATFQLPPADAASYTATHRPADWHPLPLDAAVLAFTAAPEEIPAAFSRGVYVCDVAPWTKAATPPFVVHNPAAPATAPLGRWRVAAFDPSTGTLMIVDKNMY